MPIDVAQLRYDVTAVTPQGWSIRLWSALEALDYEEDQGGLAGRLSLTLRDGPAAPVLSLAYNAPAGALERLWVRDLLSLGTPLVLFAGTAGGLEGYDAPMEEVQRYFVTGVEYGDDRLRLTAYDDLYRLTRSEWDKVFEEGLTGRDVIGALAAEWGIPVGDVRGPNVPLPKLALQGTLADTILDVLRTSYVQSEDEPEYVVRMTRGQLDVVPVGGNDPVYWFHPAYNLSTRQAQMSQDIAELVTEIQIVGQGKPAGDPSGDPADPQNAVPEETVALLTTDLAATFGRFRRVVRTSTADSPEAARATAAQLLATSGAPRRRETVAVPDYPFLRKGDLVRLTTTTLDGRYVVAGIQHGAVPARQMTLTVDDSGTLLYRLRLLRQAGAASAAATEAS